VTMWCPLAEDAALVVHAEARLAVTDVPNIVALLVATAELVSGVVAERTELPALRLAKRSDAGRLVATGGTQGRSSKNQGESE
jgi:hypothetical protein